jgi:hypothetical protein
MPELSNGQMATNKSRTALLAAIAAVTMLLAALSSAYLVRRGLGNDWAPSNVPLIIWISPVALLCAATGRASLWLTIAAALAIMMACRQQAGSGPSTAFFYLFSGVFLTCLLVGVAARAFRIYWLCLAGLLLWVLLLMEIWP